MLFMFLRVAGVLRAVVAADAPEGLPDSGAVADALFRRNRRHAPQELLLLGRGGDRH